MKFQGNEDKKRTFSMMLTGHEVLLLLHAGYEKIKFLAFFFNLFQKVSLHSAVLVPFTRRSCWKFTLLWMKSKFPLENSPQTKEIFFAETEMLIRPAKVYIRLNLRLNEFFEFCYFLSLQLFTTPVGNFILR